MRFISMRGVQVRNNPNAINRAAQIASETLERRVLLSAFQVTDNGDSGAGTLRQAIMDANSNPGTDEITFDLAPGSKTITPTTFLPFITDPVTIDGTTDPDFVSTPIVELSGASAGSVDGLTLSTGSDGSTIKGLVINGFTKAGILIDSDNNIIEGNYIGTDVAGTTAVANGGEGILIEQASGNTIGGTTAAQRNVLSGNTLAGVNIEGLVTPAVTDPGTGDVITPAQLADADQNLIEGNYIGVDATGAAALGNGESGIIIFEATSNTVGGVVAGAGNVISANGIDGVQISTATDDSFLGATGNFIGGNEIGTDVIGKVDLGNTDDGVHIIAGHSNTIGDVGLGRNIISGNGGDGIDIVNAGIGAASNADSNFIQNNYIGTSVDGTAALENNSDGVFISGGGFNEIGGVAEGNLISGNGSNGVALSGGSVFIFSVTTDHTFIEANIIGLDSTGNVLGNGGNGIDLEGDSNTTIGSGDDSDRNIISGNDGNGISVSGFAESGAVGSTTSASIQGDYIGLDPTGKLARPNKLNGISITPITAFGPSGSDTTIAGNFISGNTGAGISATGGNGDIIQSNVIGADVDGDSLGNGAEGILMADSTVEQIGGTVSGAGNTIAFNGAAGVAVTGTSDGVSIQLNSIYKNTGLGIDLGNDGVTPNDNGTQDADTGPNGLQNFPVLTSVVTTGGTTEIKGTLDSGASSTFTIELFANNSGDPAGQGRTHLLGISKITSAGGTTSFDDILSVALTAGQFVTATATDTSSSDTSEFSAALTATITPTKPTISINDVSMTEGNSGQKNFVFTVSLSHTSASNVTVHYATADGTAIAPTDYTKITNTLLTIPAGQLSKTITVKVNGDNTVENNETFFVNLSSAANATISDSQGKGTIVNDDASGTVSVVPDPCDSSKTALKFVGTANDDTIVVTNASANVQGKSVVTINGVNKGTFNFTGRILGYGGAGNDKITIDSHITRTAQIYGEAGNDTISGGSGNDLLFGGDGNDQLNGNAGRDILIGQLNNDSLNGGAGEDVLIAGSTNLDNNMEAWCDIQQEWFRTDVSYSTRVHDLINGGGKNNSFKLNATDVFSAPQQPDTLTGAADTDLFYAASSGDKITDKASNETVVVVKSN